MDTTRRSKPIGWRHRVATTLILLATPVAFLWLAAWDVFGINILNWVL